MSDGQIRFVHDGGEAAPAYEVSVSDGALSSAPTAAAIAFTNVNDAPEITSAAAVSVTENQLAVQTVTSDDVDAGDTAAYALSGGADAARFEIDAASGALTFRIAPDAERPGDVGGDNAYEVVVRVSDAAGASAERAVTVTVTDGNDDPVITSGGGGATAALEAAENATAVTLVTATDADAGDSVRYALAGGADRALFDIDAVTGALTFRAPPDFETRADANGDGVYEVTTSASDALGASDEQSIAVTVTDVNEAPTLTAAGTLDTPENRLAVLTVTSRDVDAGDTVRYAIVGGDDAASFEIDADTGELRFRFAPDFELPADTDANGVYGVTVRASDGGGASAVRAFAITVTDVNDDPVITSVDSVDITENRTAVSTMTSTDVDGGTPRWSIAGGADRARFAIDAATGALSFRGAPDFENPTDAGRDNVHEVVVGVSDGNGGTASRLVRVVVGDVEELPTAVPDVLAAREDTPRRIALAELLGNDIDPDGETLRLVDFSQPVHGTLVQTPDGTLEYRPEANFSGRDSFGYTLEDAGGNRASAEVALDVAEVNDPPVLGERGAPTRPTRDPESSTRRARRRGRSSSPRTPPTSAPSWRWMWTACRSGSPWRGPMPRCSRSTRAAERCARSRRSTTSRRATRTATTATSSSSCCATSSARRAACRSSSPPRTSTRRRC